jgi:hypothetical protein
VIVAGHIFEGSFCGKCGRDLCDILSYTEMAKVGDSGIACSGQLTGEELATLQAARAEQLKAVERAMA